MQSFFIPLRLPDLNIMLDEKQRRRGAGSVYSQTKVKVQADIVKIILASKIKPIESASFHFTWLEASRRRNKDNISVGQKYIFDALVTAKIIKNDGWDEVIRFWHDFDVQPNKIGVIVDILEGVG